ncbi:MAG: acyltransferase [Leptolyngbyaceae cyanobacterium RU_5_1]|nr:acyltransferase [Leptolyngbyaceae cyanobacterium RU_5_1]
MTVNTCSVSKRIAWLEGLRGFAALMILLYHAQLLMTDYAFTPQPGGLFKNVSLMAVAGDRLGHPLISVFAAPVWFGFQFVDVFVLVSGFSLVLSLKGKPLQIGNFLKRRFLRILSPFWTVVWLSYPVLWAIGIATNSYIPHAWHFFAAATFPLLYDYQADLLLQMSGPWWFVSLILSFTFIFPFLWRLLQRWGARNLLLISLLITLLYRALAVYQFGGHPTYVVLETPANWLPFLPFVSKLSTFVLGMVVAQAYLQGRGSLFWKPRVALLIGISVYALGFVSQFYLVGWVVSDLLLPIGLVLCSMAIVQALPMFKRFESVMLWIGTHSYSYFLIHNFVVDRTINLVVHQNLQLYYLLLPGMVFGTLLLSVVVDTITPTLQQLVLAILQDIDSALTTTPTAQTRRWNTDTGDRVL